MRLFFFPSLVKFYMMKASVTMSTRTPGPSVQVGARVLSSYKTRKVILGRNGRSQNAVLTRAFREAFFPQSRPLSLGLGLQPVEALQAGGGSSVSRRRPLRCGNAIATDNAKLVEDEGEENRPSSSFVAYWPLKVGAVLVALAVAVLKVPALNAIATSSGFSAAFSLIFISEIGDKTFFLAALLAAQKSKALVLVGAMGALSLMSVIFVGIGYVFKQLPGYFHSSVPIIEYVSVALLILFGVQSLRDGFSPDAKDSTEEELVSAKEELKAGGVKDITALSIVLSSFLIIFAAEWGDRSMIATVALVASQSPIGVAIGSIAGHLAATLIAIVGGALVCKHLSDKLIKKTGGALFLMIGLATLAGVF